MQASWNCPHLRRGLEQFVIRKHEKLSIFASSASRSQGKYPIPISCGNTDDVVVKRRWSTFSNVSVRRVEGILCTWRYLHVVASKKINGKDTVKNRNRTIV